MTPSEGVPLPLHAENDDRGKTPLVVKICAHQVCGGLPNAALS